MIRKRSWLGVFAIPLGLAVVTLMGADRMRLASGGAIDPTCTSSSPCIEYDNTSTGPGIRGESQSGNGLSGIAGISGTSPSNGHTGVFGKDASTSGSTDSGVNGLSVRGVGVLGTSTTGAGVSGVSSSAAGVLGSAAGNNGVTGMTTFNSTSKANGKAGVFGNDRSSSGTFNSGVGGISVRGAGVTGTSTSGDGVFGTSTNLAGVHGVSTNNNGVFGFSTEPVASGVYGENDGGGYGVAARVTVASGLPALFADAGFTGNSAVFAEGLSGSGLLFEGLGPTADVFTVDTSGNVDAHSYSSGLAAVTGKSLVTYAPHVSEPIVEDFGEAQLSNGSTYVRLESRFASLMARGSSYLVFITPEGDNRGLYVTQKSAAGFAVRESQGGHSTLAFCYRIVAKPLGNQSPRLPNYIARKETLPVPIKR